MAQILNIVPQHEKPKKKRKAKRVPDLVSSNLIQPKKPPPELHTQPEREVWEYTVTHMKKLGNIANIDRDLLSQYCQMFVKWQELQQEASDESATIEHPQTGVLSSHPVHKLLVAVSSEVSRLRAALDIDPRGRKKKQEAAEKESILKRLDEDD